MNNSVSHKKDYVNLNFTLTKRRVNATIGVRMKISQLIKNLKYFKDHDIAVQPDQIDVILQVLMEFDELKSVIQDTVDTAIELYSLLFALTGEFE